MKPHLEITEANIAAMEAFSITNGAPVVMVNLMQVRATACYEDAALNDCSGYEAFARYTQGSSEVRQHAGAELIWSGRALQMPIGPSEKTWDLVALVRYPSAKAYIEMIATKASISSRPTRR